MFSKIRTKPVAIITFLFIFMFASLVLPANEADAFSYGFRTAPLQTVGVTRPTITLYFDTDMPDSPTSYAMTLNGQSVPVSYDKTKGTFSYTPDRDLAPGDHTVKLSIEYKGYEPIVKTWSFSVAQNAVNSYAAASTSQLDGFAAINDYRTLYGLPPIKMNEKLNASATAHANYLSLNKIQQSGFSQASLHDESPGNPGFTGSSPLERAAYFNYTINVGEDAAYTGGTVNEAMDALFDAPYHRNPFLNPYIKEMGVGKIGDYTIIEFGMESDPSSKLVVSPAEGDRYVPTTFNGNEEPDPIRIHSGATVPVGYPIMAQYYGDGVTKVKLISAELTDGDKQPVELLANSPDTDDQLTTAVILFARKPLNADTSYHVKLQLQLTKSDGSMKTEQKEWDFTTEPTPGIGKTKLHQNASDYRKMYVNASPILRTASFGLDASSYTVDGVEFSMKKQPVIVDGSSYLYIRDLAAALGASVEWDEQQRAAVYTKGKLKVTLFTTRNEYELNGKLQQTATPARLIGDNTMVPVRLLAEVLGAKVDYIEATRTVKLTY